MDHNDPAIQHHVFASEGVQSILGPFASKEITASSLRSLGDALSPSARQIQEANRVVSMVQQEIASSTTLSVHRIAVGGSFGKRTSLPDFDIDLVLFINDASPPFQSELTALRRFLETSVAGITMVKASPYSITFYLNRFKVDLLLAPNLVVGISRDPRLDQHKALLRKIANQKNGQEETARFLSPAFVESVVHYMKKQSPFVNAAVRLGKLWKKSCAVTPSTFPRWFSSFLVELIAADAALKELRLNPNQASLVRVFRAFLLQISKPSKLKLVCTDYYSEKDVPLHVLQERPLVMDPVNPFLNVAKHMDWIIIQLLAEDTLAVLNKSLSETGHVNVGDLFCPRLGEDVPRLFKWIRFQMRFIKSGSWLRVAELRRIADLKGATIDPGVRWRAPEKLERNDVASVAKPYILGMFDQLTSVTFAALSFHVSRKAQQGVSEVVAACQFIDEMLLEVFDQSPTQWSPTTLTEDSCDVTCVFGQVPISSRCPDDLRYLYFSLSFDVNDVALDYLCHQIATDLRHSQPENSE